jgi:tetratricopeptide (TPR) repeat protein
LQIENCKLQIDAVPLGCGGAPPPSPPEGGEGRGEEDHPAYSGPARQHWTNFQFSIFNFQFLVLLTLLGCHSAPPPPPAPPAVAMAERAGDQAAKLSQQQQNWPAAARAWQLAADRFSLLNDRAGEATALHNLAQAQRELGRAEEAHRNLEEAAKLNEKLGRTSEWWRNQIALLQTEAQFSQTERLKARFEKLSTLSPPAEPSNRALFVNEFALWQQSQGELGKAEKAFVEVEQIFTTSRDSLGLATIAANRAELFDAQKNYTSAIASWKAALARFEALHDPAGITRALAGLGRTLLNANHDLADAEDLLRRAVRNYRLLQKPKQAQVTLELLVQCLNLEGKQKEAEAAREEAR